MSFAVIRNSCQQADNRELEYQFSREKQRAEQLGIGILPRVLNALPHLFECFHLVLSSVFQVNCSTLTRAEHFFHLRLQRGIHLDEPRSGRFGAFAGEFLRRINAEFAADGDFPGGLVCRSVSGSLQSASRSGMKRRPALAGSRKGKLPLPTVLRSSPTQSDPSAAGERQSLGMPNSEFRISQAPPPAAVPPAAAPAACRPSCGSGKRRIETRLPCAMPPCSRRHLGFRGGRPC